MANADYKSTDALMRHLRENGIAISGSSQKQQLINTGYFHGYKGYRFFISSNNQLPFNSYNEINATIQYDTKLKSLLYGKMMFIETALKNIALNTIMTEIDSSSIHDMYDQVVNSYKNAPTNTSTDIKKKYQNNKLNLQGSIQNSIAAAYRKDNHKITHFYNNINYNEVPLWAIFEILTMGDFGYLLSCLTIDMREKIGDYIILICYYLKLLKVSKKEIKALIREFEKITLEYETTVNPSVSSITIHPDLASRMTILKNSL